MKGFPVLIFARFLDHTSSGENVTGNDSHPVLLYRYDSHPSCSHVSSSNYGLSVVILSQR